MDVRAAAYGFPGSGLVRGRAPGARRGLILDSSCVYNRRAGVTYDPISRPGSRSVLARGVLGVQDSDWV